MRGKAIGKRIAGANPDITRVMLEQNITIGSLADRIGRHRTTVWKWLSDPELDEARRAIIWNAIKR